MPERLNILTEVIWDPILDNYLLSVKRLVGEIGETSSNSCYMHSVTPVSDTNILTVKTKHYDI